MDRYKIKLDHFHHYVIVKVYKTRSAMRKGISQQKKVSSNDCRGMFSPMEAIIDAKGNIFHSTNIGTLFLNEQDLGTGVVSHECLHAAMTHERFVNGFDMQYGDGIESLDDEERLAYLLTFYCKNVYDILYKNKHIKRKY